MWSQYGQNHYGICLVFSKRELEAVLAEKESQVKFYKADYVQYFQQGRQQGQPWKIIDGTRLEIDGTRLEKERVEKYSLNFIKENSKELFFLKHIDYRDEAEFRVVVLDPDNKLEYLDISSFIKCVIIGDRTPEAYYPLIEQRRCPIHSWRLKKAMATPA